MQQRFPAGTELADTWYTPLLSGYWGIREIACLFYCYLLRFSILFLSLACMESMKTKEKIRKFWKAHKVTSNSVTNQPTIIASETIIVTKHDKELKCEMHGEKKCNLHPKSQFQTSVTFWFVFEFCFAFQVTPLYSLDRYCWGDLLVRDCQLYYDRNTGKWKSSDVTGIQAKVLKSSRSTCWFSCVLLSVGLWSYVSLCFLILLY